VKEGKIKSLTAEVAILKRIINQQSKGLID
jgi:hypothetical protein